MIEDYVENTLKKREKWTLSYAQKRTTEATLFSSFYILIKVYKETENLHRYFLIRSHEMAMSGKCTFKRT